MFADSPDDHNPYTHCCKNLSLLKLSTKRK